MLKKILTGILVLLTAAFTGCGGSGGSSGDVSASGPSVGALAIIDVEAQDRGYTPDCTINDVTGTLATTGNVNPQTDHFTDGTLDVDLDIYQLGQGGAWFLDWLNNTHPGVRIYSVFVDSAHGGYLYQYDGESASDNGLHAQAAGQSSNWGEIQNIAFCYLKENGNGSADYEGCTLGYWGATRGGPDANGSKGGEVVHQASWDEIAAYDTATALSEAGFIGAPVGDDTLLTALRYKGGPTLEDKKNLLLKQAVAALLSAAHPDVNYPLVEAEIVDAVNAALASDDQGTILDLQETLNVYNNYGCPLN